MFSDWMFLDLRYVFRETADRGMRYTDESIATRTYPEAPDLLPHQGNSPDGSQMTAQVGPPGHIRNHLHERHVAFDSPCSGCRFGMWLYDFGVVASRPN